MNPIRIFLRDQRWARSILLRLRSLTSPRLPKIEPATSISILMYHGMRSHEQKQFRLQIELLREMHQIVSIEGALAHLDGGSGHRVCLTFDDGAHGAFEYAAPILAEYGAPATFFVVPCWLDEARPDSITWDECRQLRAAGFEIGSHSLTHRRLSDLSPVEVTDELSRSRARIEAAIGAPCLHFACPWGQPTIDFDPVREPEIARNVGYRSFLTTIQRRVRVGDDPWALPRIRMEPSWGLDELRYALSRGAGLRQQT